ncbi:MAG: AMP-dependent synthetase/ligase [Saccharofermentanales bacterium]
MKKNAPYYEVREIADLKDMLRQSVEIYKDKAAFLIKGKKGEEYQPVSFIQYGRDVDAFGTALHSLNVENARIAIFGESRYEWYVSYLSTVNGNGICVPLDKELPKNEIANLINRSHSNILIYSGAKTEDIEAIRDQIPSIRYFIDMDAQEDTGDVLSFDKLLKKGEDMLLAGNKSFLEASIDPEALQVILFTSGTTADSKAVMLCHRNIAYNLMNMCKMLYIGPEDTFLSVLPLHHTYECTCGFLCQIYRGSTIAQCEGLRYIVKNMQESKVTIMLAVPLMIESFYRKIYSKENAAKLKKAVAVSNALRKVGIDVRKKLFAKVHNTFGGHLKLLISGGAPIDPYMMTALQDLGINVVQGYGLTECSPILALNRDIFYKNASAGMVLPGVDVKIVDVDENGNGEIIAKGDNVMMGYYENEEATKACMIDGYFYTGDVGYIDEDRFVFITGRKKNVIITKNGKNIFPEEIETMLLREPFMKEVLVYGKPEEDGDTSVSAEIFPDFDALKEEMGEAYTPEAVRKLIGEEVKNVNKSLTPYKAIRYFDIHETEFVKTTKRSIKRSAFVPVNTQTKV